MAALTYHDDIRVKNLADSLEFKEGSIDKRLEMLEDEMFKLEGEDLDQQSGLSKAYADYELEELDIQSKFRGGVKPKPGQRNVDAIDEVIGEDDKKRKKIMKRLKKELQDILDSKYELKRKILSTQREREYKRVREVVMKGDEKTQMKTASQELERVQREIQEMKSRGDAPS